jgi:hypothetical protein
MCGCALLWVGMVLLGGDQPWWGCMHAPVHITTHKDVPMSSGLTTQVSGIYALFPINYLVILNYRQCSWLSIDTCFVSFCQVCFLKEWHQVG